jgi:hypothetical protein
MLSVVSKLFMLSVVMQNVVMPGVIMLNVVVLSNVLILVRMLRIYLTMTNL